MVLAGRLFSQGGGRGAGCVNLSPTNATDGESFCLLCCGVSARTSDDDEMGMCI